MCSTTRLKKAIVKEVENKIVYYQIVECSGQYTTGYWRSGV
jgi:hypothetical protein